jgi:hypothetical protein
MSGERQTRLRSASPGGRPTTISSGVAAKKTIDIAGSAFARSTAC